MSLPVAEAAALEPASSWAAGALCGQTYQGGVWVAGEWRAKNGQTAIGSWRHAFDDRAASDCISWVQNLAMPLSCVIVACSFSWPDRIAGSPPVWVVISHASLARKLSTGTCNTPLEPKVGLCKCASCANALPRGRHICHAEHGAGVAGFSAAHTLAQRATVHREHHTVTAGSDARRRRAPAGTRCPHHACTAPR